MILKVKKMNSIIKYQSLIYQHVCEEKIDITKVELIKFENEDDGFFETKYNNIQMM